MTDQTNAPTLIVPIDVAVLLVGNNDVNGDLDSDYGTHSFAQLAAEFDTLPYLDSARNQVRPGPNLGGLALPKPFQPATPPLQPGAHLHWALPDALTHGASDADGTVRFPAAPNRWRVVRIAATDTAYALRAWIIESDQLWDPASARDPLPQNAESRAVPVTPPSGLPNPPYATLGRVYCDEAWSGSAGSAYLDPHTAIGYGTIAFAAAYPLCPNVFGFHDTLVDLDQNAFPPSTTRLSYIVSGWYSDPKNDPLTNQPNPTTAYRWSFDPGPSTTPPSRTLCSGLLCGVTWDPSTRYIQPRPETPLEVAIGNTTVEALSALLAADPQLANLPNVETVINALQLGLLRRLDEPGGLATCDEALHQNRFGTTNAGSWWVITQANATTRALDDAATALRSPLPAGIDDALDALNRAQLAADEAQRTVTSMRGQLFSDWWKAMDAAHAGPIAGAPTGDEAFAYLESTSLVALDAAVKQLGALNATLQQQQSAVTAQLGDGYVLKSVAAPRFFGAVDPVVLLSGADATASPRYGGDGRAEPDGTLRCRLSTSLLSKMAIAGTPFALTATELPSLAASPATTFATELSAILAEAFLVDPDRAALLVYTFANMGGAGNPAITEPGQLASQIQSTQDALWGSGAADPAIALTGAAPSAIGLNRGIRWIPLFLQWEVYFHPQLPIANPATYPTNFVVDNFRLDPDQIDLSSTGAIPSPLPEPQSYSGSVVLTPNADLNLQQRITDFLADFPDDPRAPELTALSATLDRPMMAQALGGLHPALTMREQSLQLPIFDPLASLDGTDRECLSNVTIPKAVAGENVWAPAAERSYNPIRAGVMTLARLRIVDAFGQVRDLTSPPIIRAQSLTPPGSTSGDGLVGLPPRLAQPSRLLFRWLAADGDRETNSADTTSPICGWVLYDHLDGALAIYDADGSALGSLNTFGPLWQGAPGTPLYGQPIEQALANANAHLRAFALSIAQRSDSVAFLTDLLTTIDRTSLAIEPPGTADSAALAVLVGRPLALVRASLRLELDGPPALDQGWAAFTDAVKAKQRDGRASAAFASVRFPVQLGALQQIDDGLIGYFLDDGSAQAYRTFYAAAGQSTSGEIVPPQLGTVTVAAADSAAATVAMLVDPRAAVHATTGFLPVKQLDIPSQMVAEALRRMAITIPVAPLLSSASDLAMPLAQENGWRWSWLAKDPTTKQWKTSQVIGAVDGMAKSSIAPLAAREGWLRLTKNQSARTLSRMRPASSSSPAIAVSVATPSATDLPTLFITNDPTRNQLVVTISNVGDGPLALSAGRSSFAVGFGSLLAGQALDSFGVGTPPTWTASFTPQAPGWTFTPTVDQRLAAGESLHFTLDKITARASPQTGGVTVAWSNLDGIAPGSSTTTLFLHNPPSPTNRDIVFLSDFNGPDTVLLSGDEGDEETCSLRFYLGNPSPTTPIPPPDAPPGAAVFTLSFVFADPPGTGALTTVARAADMEVGAGPQAAPWTVRPNTDLPSPTWTLYPPAGHPIVGVGAAAYAQFQIDNIVCPFDVPDLTPLYLQYAGIPGINDGVVTLTIRKVATVKITSLTTTPGWGAIADGSSSVTLAWKVRGANALELRTPTDAYDVSKKTSKTIDGISATTDFILHASGPNQTFDDRKATFPVFDLRVNPPVTDIGVNVFIVACSPKRPRIYAANSQDHDALIAVLDATTNRVLYRGIGDPNQRVNQIALDPTRSDRDRLYVAVRNGLHVYDADDTKLTLLAKIAPSTYGSESVAVTSDGSRVFVSGSDTHLTFAITEVEVHSDGGFATKPFGDNFTSADIRCIALSPDDKRLYSASGGANVDVYDTATGHMLASVVVGPKGGYAFQLAVSPTTGDVYVGMGGGIAVVRVQDNFRVDSIQTNMPLGAFIQISPDGTMLYLTNGTGSVGVIDCATGALRTTLAPFSPVPQLTGGIGVSADGSTLYAGAYNELGVITRRLISR